MPPIRRSFAFILLKLFSLPTSPSLGKMWNCLRYVFFRQICVHIYSSERTFKKLHKGTVRVQKFRMLYYGGWPTHILRPVRTAGRNQKILKGLRRKGNTSSSCNHTWKNRFWGTVWPMAKDKEATPAVQLEFYQTHYDVVRIMYMLPFFQIFLNIIRTKN
jgi:hypothetical protein